MLFFEPQIIIYLLLLSIIAKGNVIIWSPHWANTLKEIDKIRHFRDIRFHGHLVYSIIELFHQIKGRNWRWLESDGSYFKHWKLYEQPSWISRWSFYPDGIWIWACSQCIKSLWNDSFLNKNSLVQMNSMTQYTLYFIFGFYIIG